MASGPRKIKGASPSFGSGTQGLELPVGFWRWRWASRGRGLVPWLSHSVGRRGCRNWLLSLKPLRLLVLGGVCIGGARFLRWLCKIFASVVQEFCISDARGWSRGFSQGRCVIQSIWLELGGAKWSRWTAWYSGFWMQRGTRPSFIGLTLPLPCVPQVCRRCTGHQSMPSP